MADTASFFPDRQAQLDWVTASTARFRQIDDYAADVHSALVAQHVANHYANYPWTNPGLALAFSKWKAQYGGGTARALARVAFGAVQANEDPQNAVEKFAMTKEFQRLAKPAVERAAYKQVTSGGGILGGLEDLASVSGIAGPVALLKGEGLGSALQKSIPGQALLQEAQGPATEAIGQIPYAGDALKGISRTAFTAASTPLQTLQAGATNAVTGLIGPVGNQAQPTPVGSEASQLGAASGTPSAGAALTSSVGAIAIRKLIAGDPVDLGTGYFPGGQVERQHVHEVRALGSIDYGGQEHYLTPGRLVALGVNNAFGVAEPGSVPFKALSGFVDATAVVKVDPVNVGLGILGDLHNATKVFSSERDLEAAGGITKAWRQFTQGPTVEQWLGSDRGNRVISALKGQPLLDVMRATNWKLPVEAALPLSKEGGGANLALEDAKTILKPVLGVDAPVSEIPNPFSFGAKIRQVTGPYRIFDIRPANSVDLSQLDGPDGALRNIAASLNNARVPDEQISQVIHDVAAARSGFGRFEALKLGQRAAYDMAVARGLPEEEAARITKLFYNDLGLGAQYFTDAIGHGTDAGGVVIDGEFVPTSSPHLWNQAMNDKLWLPDPKRFDQAVARYGRLWGIQGTGETDIRGAVERAQEATLMGESALLPKVQAAAGSAVLRTKYAAYMTRIGLQHVQSNLLIPLQILKAGLPLKIIGEAHAIMAASGYDSLLNSPIKQVAMVVGSEGGLTDARLLDSSELAAKLDRTVGIFQDDATQKVIARGQRIISPEDGPAHARAWADELLGYHMDPVTRQVARALQNVGEPVAATGAGEVAVDPLAAVKDSFWGRAPLSAEEEATAKDLRTQIRRLNRAIGKRPEDTEQLTAWQDERANLSRQLADIHAQRPVTGEDEGLATYRRDLMEQPKLKAVLANRQGSDAYIDHLADSIGHATSGHPPLVDFVATGKYGSTEEQLAGQISLNGRYVVNPTLDPTLEGQVVRHRPGDTMADVMYPGADQPIHTRVSDLEFTATQPIKARSMAQDGVRTDSGFIAYLNGMPEEVKPQQVLGDLTRSEGKGESWARHTIDVLYSTLMARPYNYLARSPVLKQRYWTRLAEILPDMDLAGRNLAQKVADESGHLVWVPRALLGGGIGAGIAASQGASPEEIVAATAAGAATGALYGHFRGEVNPVGDYIKAALKDAGEPGTLDYSTADELAKGRALQDHQDLLHDLNRRGQFFNATRLLFPFGDAWKQIMVRWAKVVGKNPDIVRKFQVGIESLRGTNPLSGIPGAVPQAYKDQGFFFKDSFGGESFAMPWSQPISDALIGTKVPFTGSAGALNMAFNIMPGVGLAAQIPANAFMSKFMSDPKYDPIRELISPFGAPDLTAGLQAIAPAWMKRALTALNLGQTPNDTRLFNDTVKQILAQGQADGTYDFHSPQGIQHAIDDAGTKAREVYGLRAVLQFGSPSPPSPQFIVEAGKKHPRLVTLDMLRTAMYKLEADPKTRDNAVGKFIERFGEQAFYATRPLSLTTGYDIPWTKTQGDWVRTHGKIVDKYPSVYGLFAPRTKPGDVLDYPTYLAGFGQGRETLDPKDWVRKTNNLLGLFWYDKIKKDAGLTQGQSIPTGASQIFVDKRDEIRKAYPGFLDLASTPNKTAHAIEDLGRAANDPQVKQANPQLAEAIREYMAKRADAIDIMRQAKITVEFGRPGFTTSAKTAGVRAVLRDAGNALVKQYPAFADVWEQVFSNEVRAE